MSEKLHLHHSAVLQRPSTRNSNYALINPSLKITTTASEVKKHITRTCCSCEHSGNHTTSCLLTTSSSESAITALYCITQHREKTHTLNHGIRIGSMSCYLTTNFCLFVYICSRSFDSYRDVASCR